MRRFSFAAGYLKVLKTMPSFNDDFMCEVALPNKEIFLVYHKEILQKLDHMIPQPTAISIQEAIFSGNNDKLKTAIQTMLAQSATLTPQERILIELKAEKNVRRRC